jgi:hypothetical protein
MLNFKVNEEEIALLNAYRMLTTRQRAMIFSAVVSETGSYTPALKLVAANITPILASSSKLACNT